MTRFKLSENRDNNKVFLLNRSELEKRFDPFYYIPELTELEKKVSRLNPEKLRHYVLSIGSGATPKTTESEKYYSDKEKGIPFLRVQNLSPTGILEFDDCKYINHETHNNYLKRSQVKEGDLLVKITGVGRMAVSSIAPDGFIGNTNQHMVVIRTGDKKISEIIAAYLNTDIGDKLASRRATGGTRPALDYSALLSMQVVYDEKILEISKNAVSKKQELENQAQQLLASIDDYLLNELGITLPENENNLTSRVFNTKFSEISGGRFDPDYFSLSYDKIIKAISTAGYDKIPLKQTTTLLKSGKTPSSQDYSEEETEYPIIKAGSYTKEYIDLAKLDYVINKQPYKAKTGDFYILSAAHQSQYVGRHIKYLNEEPKNDTSFVGELICVRTDANICNSMFLFSLLNCDLFKTLINREKTGQTSHIYSKDIAKIKIPLPPLKKQNEIAKHIEGLRTEAKRLQKEAKQEMENAKQEIEKRILSQ